MSRADRLRAEADLIDAEAAFVKAKSKGRDSKAYKDAKEHMRGLRAKVRNARESVG